MSEKTERGQNGVRNGLRPDIRTFSIVLSAALNGEWLGKETKMIKNRAGDSVFLSQGLLIKKI